jgi:hypothetical protein
MHRLGKRVPIEGMSENPVPPCLLFALLFDLFVLSRTMILGRSELETLNLEENRPSGNLQISGKMDPKHILSVPQHIGSTNVLSESRLMCPGIRVVH